MSKIPGDAFALNRHRAGTEQQMPVNGVLSAGEIPRIICPVMYSGIQLSSPSIISPKGRLRSCTISRRSPFLRIAASPSIHFLENSISCASSSIGISLQINTGSRDRESAVALRKSSVA